MPSFGEAMGNVANAGMIMQMVIQAKDLTKQGLSSANRNVKSFETQHKTSMAACKKSVEQYNQSMAKTTKSVQGLSPAMQGIDTRKLEQLGVKSTQTQGLFQSMTDSIKNNARAIGGAMVGAASIVAGAYVMILKSAMNSAAQSEQKWGRLTIALGKSGFQIKEVKKEWSGTVDAIHASTGRMRGDITLALGDMAKFGLTQKQVMVDSVKTISALTFITQGDFAQISDTYADMINRQQLMIRSVGNLGLNVDNFTKTLKDHGYELEDWKDLTKDQRAEMINLAVDTQNGANTVERANKEYAESYEGLMNRIEQFKKVMMSAIGNVLLPYAKDMMRDVIPVLKKMVDWFKALPDPIKKAVIALPLVVSGLMAIGGTVILLTPLATMLTGLHLQLTNLIKKIHEWNATPMLSKVAHITQIGSFAAPTAQAIGEGMAMTGGLSGTEIAATIQATAAGQELTRHTLNHTRALRQQAPIRQRFVNDLGVMKNKMTSFWKSASDSTGALQGLSGSLTMAGVGIAAMAAALAILVVGIRNNTSATLAWQKAEKEGSAQIKTLSTNKEILTQRVADLKAKRDGLIAQGKDVTQVTKDIDQAEKDLTTTTLQLNAATDAQKDALTVIPGLKALQEGRVATYQGRGAVARAEMEGEKDPAKLKEILASTTGYNSAIEKQAQLGVRIAGPWQKYAGTMDRIVKGEDLYAKKMKEHPEIFKKYAENYENYAKANQRFQESFDQGDYLGGTIALVETFYYQFGIALTEAGVSVDVWAENTQNAIKKPFLDADKAIKDWFLSAEKTLGDIGDKIAAPFRKVYCWIVGCSPGIIPALNQLTSIFTTTFNKARAIIMTVVDAIRQVVVGIGQRLASVPQLMVGYFRRGVAMTREVIYGVVQFFRDIITRVRTVLGGIYQAINTPIRNAMNAAYGAVKSVTTSVSSAFWALVSGARNAWNSVANAVRGPINTIIGFVNTLRKALGMPISGGMTIGNLSVGNIVSSARSVFGIAGGDVPGGGVAWKPDQTIDLSMIRNNKTREAVLKALYEGDIKGPEGIFGWGAGDNLDQGFWKLSNWPKMIIGAAKNLANPWLKRFGIDINKFDISKPAALGAAAFYKFASLLFDSFDYEFYYDHKYSAAQMLKYRRGNCWDMTSLLLNIARAFGLGGNMVHGTWNGIRHVWANIPPFGKMDPTAMASRHCWTCGPSAGGPGADGGGGVTKETHIHLNFNEPVYGLDDFEGRVVGVLDKSLRWIQ